MNQFAGTSVGSYNAAAMVAGAGQGFARSARRLRHIWLEQIARQPGGRNNGVFRIRGAEFARLSSLLRPDSLAFAVRDGGALAPIGSVTVPGGAGGEGIAAA